MDEDVGIERRLGDEILRVLDEIADGLRRVREMVESGGESGDDDAPR